MPQRKQSKPSNHLGTGLENFKKKEKAMVVTSKVEYADSSDEEVDFDPKILENVMKNFSAQGSGSDLGRTFEYIENSFHAAAGICLICISSIKRIEAMWSCVNCYGGFHLPCIQKWAKDSLFQFKQSAEELPVFKRPDRFSWGCPKCRYEYPEMDVPSRYYCYCGKSEDPEHHLWLVPHSCGDQCDKPLKPNCGHRCLLLCHPGPCPPCPKTVQTKCFCGKSAAKARRCSDKFWSCHQTCERKLSCNKHSCSSTCHEGSCPSCPQKSVQPCDCGLEKVNRPCSEPRWKCSKVCGKAYRCGHHACLKVCHSGNCGDCPLTEARSCPCGKTQATVICTQEIPTCQETCDKPMECGVHRCKLKCHKDKCVCLEIVRKICRCGSHQKDLPCGKEYTCESKCKLIKSCLKHPCNRKCCEGDCPPCEKPCGRTLPCGSHKCQSVCHRGACYPCPLTATVKCRCGSTSITVPCGRERKTRAPKCREQCRLPPDCHHEKRDPHRCHFGDCPPCRQICSKIHEKCGHMCPSICHSSVWVKIENQKRPAGPWDVLKEPAFRRTALPCGDCVVPVPVTCLGGHETSPIPCSRSSPSSCARQCGKQLECGNHCCTYPCHSPEEDCEECELACQRPATCAHKCTRECHPDPCATPCKVDIKVKCHCGINTLYIPCYKAKDSNDSSIFSCGNHCPKYYACGHKCRSNCHPGDCPDSDMCRKKVKITCKCGRIKQESVCHLKQNIVCDSLCLQEEETKKMARRLEEAKKGEENEKKNQEELEKFKKKLMGKKKVRERKRTLVEDEPGFFTGHKIAIASAVTVTALSIFLYLVIY